MASNFASDIGASSRVLGTAFKRALGGLWVILPLCVLVGGLGHYLMSVVGDATALYAEPNDNSRLIYSEIGKLCVGLLWGILIFPLIDAVSIYLWRTPDKPSMGGGINWALARYRRMFVPHLAAFLSIYVGMVVLIPGILFGVMYGFVDAIAATDPKAKRPLARSAKLTKGRRRRIVLTWLPYTLWYLPAYLSLSHIAAGEGIWAVVLFGTIDIFLLQIMEMAMYGHYEERIEDALKALAAREAAAEPTETE